MMTDPIADLLTRIRNAIHAKHEVVEVPYSKLKLELLKLLEQEGYLRSINVVSEGSSGKILVTLRYTPKKEPVISHLQRISRPGLRVYVGYDEIKPVLSGMGIAVLSTSKGLMTDKQAKENKVGGELLCSVW
jgi:small subunit ribosomal protein S8